MCKLWCTAFMRKKMQWSVTNFVSSFFHFYIIKMGDFLFFLIRQGILNKQGLCWIKKIPLTVALCNPSLNVHKKNIKIILKSNRPNIILFLFHSDPISQVVLIELKKHIQKINPVDLLYLKYGFCVIDSK